MRDVLLDYKELGYLNLTLPPSLIRQVKEREAYVVLTLDNLNEDAPIGFCVMGTRKDWAVLLDVVVFDDYDSEEYAADLITRRLLAARRGNTARGIFSEFEEEEGGLSLSTAYTFAGFEVTEGQSSTLEFALSELDTSILPQMDKVAAYIRLSDADDDLRRRLSKLIQEDKRPVPVSLPVPWGSFDRRLSLIHVKEGEPVGAVLVQRAEDVVTVRLLYTDGGKGFLRLLRALSDIGQKSLPPESRIIVPVVEERLFDVIQRLVPKLKRSRMFRAVFPFGMEEGRAQKLVLMDHDDRRAALGMEQTMSYE